MVTSWDVDLLIKIIQIKKLNQMKKSEEHIKEWITKISEVRPELGNFAICPYSNSASYEVVEAPIDDIIPIKGCDVVIFVVEDYLDADAIQMWCEIYNTIYPEFIFLEDCANYHTFLNGIQTNNGNNFHGNKVRFRLCISREKLEKGQLDCPSSDKFL